MRYIIRACWLGGGAFSRGEPGSHYVFWFKHPNYDRQQRYNNAGARSVSKHLRGNK